VPGGEPRKPTRRLKWLKNYSRPVRCKKMLFLFSNG
jgi:hypothetical protein